MFDFLKFLRIQDKDVLEGPNASRPSAAPARSSGSSGCRATTSRWSRTTTTGTARRPYVDEYQIKIYRDQQAMVAALESGAPGRGGTGAHPGRRPPQEQSQVPDLSRPTRSGSSSTPSLNTKSPPTDNKLLRQAIGYAIDRKRFTDTIMKGFVGEPREPALGGERRQPSSRRRTTPTPTTWTRPGRCVQQSGCTNLEFDINWSLAGFSAEYQALATVIQADLAKIGIKTNLKPQDPPTFTAEGNGLKPTFNGMRLSAGAFCQLFEAASQFALSRTMGYASNLAGFYDEVHQPGDQRRRPSRTPAKRKQIYCADQRLPAGRRLCPGDQRLLEHHGPGRPTFAGCDLSRVRSSRSARCGWRDMATTVIAELPVYELKSAPGRCRGAIRRRSRPRAP